MDIPCGQEVWAVLHETEGRASWLTSDCMDAAVYHACMAFGWMFGPNPTHEVAVQRGIIVMNNFLWTKMRERDGAACTAWMRGIYLFDGRIKRLVLPANISSSHWVAVVVDLEHRQVAQGLATCQVTHRWTD